MRRIYEGKIIVDLSENGWCIATLYNNDKCFIFYPEGFIPNETFSKKLEIFLLKQYAKFIWIENPKDEFWKITTAINTISIGDYWINLSEKLSEDNYKINFSGSFGIENNTISQIEVCFDISRSYGLITFSFQIEPEKFDLLDISIQYLKILDDTDLWKKNYIEKFKCNVIKPQSTININASICLVDLENTQLSFFSFADTNFTSCFLSPVGKQAVLSSQNVKAVFQKSADAIYLNNGQYVPTTQTWYLTLDGVFKTQNDIMLGLSCTEFFSNISEIKFICSQNAVISNKILESTIKTAWIAIKGDYYCSSVVMPFFELKNDLFKPYNLKINTFSDFCQPFPMFLWGGLIKNCLQMQNIEDILFKTRYNLLNQNSNCVDNEIKTVITSCGLCAGIENGLFSWIGVAQTNNTGLPNIKLENPSSKLSNALKQSKCVFVVNNKDDFCSLSSNKLSFDFDIEDWSINFSEDTWDNNYLFMIKYNDDISIRSALSDYAQFKYILSLAYDNNNNVNKGFEDFVSIIDKKEFKGILLLGGTATCKTTMPEIKISSVIKSIYTIISASKINTDNQSINVSKSNINALISYDEDNIECNKNSAFDLFTRSLKTVIRESKVISFESKSELYLYTLFGEQIHTNENCLSLIGRLETTDNIKTYKFTLETPVKYIANDCPIDYIEINNVIVSGGNNQTVYNISGNLSYIKCDEIDIFSYDKLEFNNIMLVQNEQSSYIDYNNLRILNYVVRENSFVNLFGAKLSQINILYKKTPDNFGFTAINTPLTQGKLSDLYTALIFDIYLNSSGKLGKNEPLYLQMLVGFSGKEYYIGVKTQGLKLFTLQNMITIDFNSISLEKNNAEKLMLALKGFSMKMMGFNFPQKGIDLYILGDNGNICWYAKKD